MKPALSRLLIKSKLYAPVGLAIILSIVIITIQAIYNLKSSIYHSIEKDLFTQTETIEKIFKNEKNVKLENVKTYLKIAHDYFYAKPLLIKEDSILVKATNQINRNSYHAWIKRWKHNDVYLDSDHAFVDKILSLTGATASVFQQIDSGYIRITTNVIDKENNRAINTYIPNNSPVIQNILKGESYNGRAYVVDDWYLTAYEPILINGKSVGILYTGIKEKDIQGLKTILNQIKVGKSGSLFVFDNIGNVVVNEQHEGENWKNREIVKYILKNKRGIARIKDDISRKELIVAFNYFRDFDYYIAATVSEDDETKVLINQIIWQSIIYGTIIFVLLSIFIYFVTTKRLHSYLKQLEISNKSLTSTREALEQSENKFRTLFNNSSDEVFVSDYQGRFVEINQVACNTLGYSREELLKMRFFDIKTKKFRPFVSDNIKIILEKGYHTYETEHISKSGVVFQFEMKSKIIDYQGRQLILSIARNISERKALEKKIVQTIIETEIKERKRFAADLHDGLGPVLSAIRLYSDLIKRGNFNKMSQEEAINNIEELVDMAIANTKEISNNITPSVLEDFGLSVAIQEFCAFISRTKSIDIDFDHKNFSLVKPSIEMTILYQTVKELINNTIKHSHAQKIRIELKNQNNQIILYYRDDGQGFNLDEKLSESTGLGLNNIINKIKTLKGSCDFNSIEGKGMFVLISVNIDEKLA